MEQHRLQRLQRGRGRGEQVRQLRERAGELAGEENVARDQQLLQHVAEHGHQRGLLQFGAAGGDGCG